MNKIHGDTVMNKEKTIGLAHRRVTLTPWLPRRYSVAVDGVANCGHDYHSWVAGRQSRSLEKEMKEHPDGRTVRVAPCEQCEQPGKLIQMSYYQVDYTYQSSYRNKEYPIFNTQVVARDGDEEHVKRVFSELGPDLTPHHNGSWQVLTIVKL